MDTDVVIVGTGLAGLYTALNLDCQLKVVLVTKDKLEDCNSYLAQGGMAATLKDDYDSHIKDTLHAGHYLNNVHAVDTLVKNSSKEIKNLEKLQVSFDRTDKGFMLTKEGGHSQRRILHMKDQTGKGMIDALKQQLDKRPNITLLEDTLVVDLIVNNGMCNGVSIIQKNTYRSIYAHFTVLATGGLGGIYERTTNKKNLYGDGIAMAYHHGAKISDMEFIQFHPTAFYEPFTSETFLISEALRGEGAYIKNKKKQRFIHNYHPDGELAGRDIVSKSIYQEMLLTDSPYVYLDVTHLNKDFITERFPFIYNKCDEKDYDMTEDFIPVSPVQHYTIGGIQVDLCGRTTIQHLYASGECACTGVHGANRLASNSLLECVVFSSNIAHHINNSSPINKHPISTPSVNIEDTNEEDYIPILNTIQNIIQNHCWLVRDKSSLALSKKQLMSLYEQLRTRNKKYCKNYFACLNALTCGLLIIQHSLQRKKSIGCFILKGE